MFNRLIDLFFNKRNRHSNRGASPDLKHVKQFFKKSKNGQAGISPSEIRYFTDLLFIYCLLGFLLRAKVEELFNTPK